MIRLLIRIICFALPVHVTCVRAQSYSSVHYDTKDGLPSATVYNITQDKNGFIWFGTENGLSRFDGKNFKTFTTKDGLPDNSILKVHGDNTGRLYFTPFTHSLYFYQNDSFFKVPIPDKYKVDLSLITYLINKKDQLLIFGQNQYILEGDSLIPFVDKYKIKPKYIIKIYDTLIIGRTDDTIFFIPDSGKVRSYVYNSSDLDGAIFDENAQKQQLKVEEKLTGIAADILSAYFNYIFTENFLYIYRSSTGRLVHKIKMNKFSSIFLDNENNLWVSTLGDGVYRFPSFDYRNIDFNGKNEIFSLIKTGRQVIAGSDFSKMYSLPVNQSDSGYSMSNFSNFTASSGNPHSRQTKRNRIYTLFADESDLYIGTDAFLLKKTKAAPPVFREIYPVKDIDMTGNKMMVCTGHCVLLLDKRDLSFKDTLLRQRSTCGVIYHGDYYVGTLGGLIKISAATKAITELYNLFPALKARITSVKRGINDDLWIATSGSGLVHFKNDTIIRTIKEEDGLTSDICTSLYIDNDLVWLGTNNGLNRIETGGEKPGITRFTAASGLGADFINSVLSTDKNIYAGTAAGLTIFSKNIFAEKSVCILHILQVSENNKKLQKDSSYSFPHNALNIQIDFTAVSFKSAGDITYYYKLETLDRNWNTTRANSVNFPVLQPGNYHFLLKAVNKFGVESQTKTIQITIRPPWWATWTFRISAMAASALLVLLLYRYNIRNIKRKEQLKREFEARFAALEQRALQAQMNPHFIFNALNSIQTFILNLDVEGANTYLTNFANLIRQTLENSMHPLITVASELKYLESYLSLEKLRFRDKFSYNIDVDEGIDQNNTLLPGMLLQPYIENSLRHGIQHRKDNNGLISLTISKMSDHSIHCIVHDNGVGRKKAEELKSSRHIEYQSRGISINEKRISAINIQFKTNIRVSTEDLFDGTGSAAGTTVSITIPSFDKP